MVCCLPSAGIFSRHFEQKEILKALIIREDSSVDEITPQGFV
jgi:hypothetical protein